MSDSSGLSFRLRKVSFITGLTITASGSIRGTLLPISLYDLKIYDHSQRKGNVNVTVADSGRMEMTADKRNLLVTLWHGKSYSEVEEDKRNRSKTYPHRTDIFDEEKIIIAVTGFDLQRTDESLFKNYYQMLNICPAALTPPIP